MEGGLEKNGKQKTKDEITRRGFLGGLLVVGAAAAAGVALNSSRRGQTGQPEVLGQPKDPEMPEKDPLSFLNIETPSKQDRQGRWINPHKELAQMWKQKLEKIKERRGAYPPEDLAAAEKLFSTYHPDNPHKTSLENYRRSIQASINGARAGLDLGTLTTLKQFEGLSKEQIALARLFERQITADSLLAIVVTELFSSKDKENGAGLKSLEYKLAEYGRDFVALTPARHDSVFSFGDYQSTRHQISEKIVRNPKTGAREEKFNGASLINKLYGKPGRIPGDISDLKGDVHHTAAYLFAVYNIAFAVRELGPDLSKSIIRSGAYIPSSMPGEFVGAAHHRIGDAVKSLRKYAEALSSYARAPEDTQKKVEIPDFANAAALADEENKKKGKPSDMKTYVTRTRSSTRAIWSRFGIKESSQ